MPQNNDSQSQRKAYATPHLKLYGSVQTLTAGGTGPTSEQTGGNVFCNMGQNTAAQTLKHCA